MFDADSLCRRPNEKVKPSWIGIREDVNRGNQEVGSESPTTSDNGLFVAYSVSAGSPKGAPTSWVLTTRSISKRAPNGQYRAPGDCGSFAGVSSALSCFWGRFATDIPRARLLKINHLKTSKNPKKVEIAYDGYL